MQGFGEKICVFRRIALLTSRGTYIYIAQRKQSYLVNNMLFIHHGPQLRVPYLPRHSEKMKCANKEAELSIQFKASPRISAGIRRCKSNEATMLR